MIPKPLIKQLSALKILYEDAVMRKASTEERKKILQKIDDVYKKIAEKDRDRLH